MSRRTRTLQFFASPDEARALLARLSSSGLSLYEVVDGACREVRLVGPEAEVPARLFIGAEPVSAADAHRQPALWGLVMFDTPILSDGELRMGVLGAVNAWSESGSWFIDDRALRLFDRLKKTVSADLVGSVDVRSRSTGATMNYPAIRTTAGAVAVWESGVRFAQGGVAGLDYFPHGACR